MNENEYLTVNDRYYVNPQLSVDESEQFLETLRNAQKQGNAQIAQETHALGTDVPSSMGGLSGSGGIWEQRYQNPKVDSAVAKLRSVYQAQALNDTMSNLLSQKQQEYKDAYRRAYKNKENGNNPGGDNPKGEVETKTPETDFEISGVTPGVDDMFTVANIDADNNRVLGYTGVPFGGEYKENYTYKMGQGSVPEITNIVNKGMNMSWSTGIGTDNPDGHYYNFEIKSSDGNIRRVVARNETEARNKWNRQYGGSTGNNGGGGR